MPASPSPARRLATTWAAVTGLSLAGHHAGGGSIPSPVAIVLVGILALTCSAAMCRGDSPVRTRTAVLLLGALQVAGHLIFHHVSGAAPVTAWSAGGHHPVPLTTIHTALPTAAHGVTPLMLTSHLLATVVLAWLLCGHARAAVTVVLDRWLRHTEPPHLPARIRAGVPSPAGSWVSREVAAGLLLRGPPSVPLR